MSRLLSATAVPALLLALVALVALVLPAAASAERVSEWRHVWEIVQLVNVRPPSGTAIFYLGDSTARESVISDASWTSQLRRRAAKAGKDAKLRAFALTSSNQTFAMDSQLIAALPARAAGASAGGASAGIVVIGVGLSRFTSRPVRRQPPTIEPLAAGQVPVIHAWTRHRYADRQPLPSSRKQELVSRWVRTRLPSFRRYCRADVRALARLLELCRARGFTPVLAELPRDVRAAGHRLDGPRDAYRAACRRLAHRYGVAYVSPLRPTPLPTHDFWDLIHLLSAGTRTWQSRLTDRLVNLLPSTQASPAPMRHRPTQSR